MKLFVFMICFSFMASADVATFCMSIKVKNLNGQPLSESKCEITQGLSYANAEAKWTCRNSNKTNLVNLYSPDSIGYDYTVQQGFVVYQAQKMTSPFMALLKMHGVAVSSPFLNIAPIKILFGYNGPSTRDSTVFLKTPTTAYELNITLNTNYVSNTSRCL